MFDQTRVAHGLKLGRPDNRRYRYKGDKRGMVANPRLMGPDAHGVFWVPVREYYENSETLVVFAPVPPDDIPAPLRNRGLFR